LAPVITAITAGPGVGWTRSGRRPAGRPAGGLLGVSKAKVSGTPAAYQVLFQAVYSHKISRDPVAPILQNRTLRLTGLRIYLGWV
jgi:hypothetical protein